MINYDVKFITSNENFTIKHSDDKIYKYETKKRSDESIFDYGKRDYLVRRGGHWRTPQPRHLKRLETMLRDQAVVDAKWMNDSLISIVFSSGTIAYLTVKLETSDVTHILFDRYFVGKLAGQLVTNVAICKSHMLFTHSDRTATLVSFGKNISSVPCRVSDRDPSLHCIELAGAARRSERLVSCCDTPAGARVLVWSVAGTEPAPWSPISAIEDLANLHLYQITGNNISLLAYHQLENETLCAELSQHQDVVHIVEQTAYQKNGVSLDWLRYDIPAASRAQKLSSRCTTRVSFPAPARAVRRDPPDARLLVACIDGSLHVVHRVAGLTRSVKAGFIATAVHWAGALVLAGDDRRVQCFDRALTSLHHHSHCIDVTAYTTEGRRLQVLCSQRARGGSVVLASFSGGPLALLTISHPRLLSAWISARRLSSAVSLLQEMDWEREGTECLWAVNKLLCQALRSGTECVVSERAAQGALGAFLAPLAPLGAPAQRYHPPAIDLARKFFHHLLRRGRIEKAMGLGVDLGAWDLFADARWAAQARHQPALAAEAASTAAHLAQHQTDSESSTCSSCASPASPVPSDVTDEPPPPAPRPRPPLPALLPVLPPPETQSTSSIRPNLHQYLERDASIWNSEVASEKELKPILSTQGSKWSEQYKSKLEPTKAVDVLPRHDAYKHVFQEAREPPRTLYRYQHSPGDRHQHGPTDRHQHGPGDRHQHCPADRHQRQDERHKNKVKFSDTVTIAVVAGSAGLPAPAQELADSLPLSPPHNYLAAFAPLTPRPESSSQKQPKIKVIQLGMV